MRSNATSNIRQVTIQFSLCMSPPLEPLLTGPEAAELIGDAGNADILLQPSSGEIIAAHSAYLLRNPYFAAHLSFVEVQDRPLDMPIRVNAPHPAHFRFNLECIYANIPEFAHGTIVQNSFVPLAVNAQFLQDENLLSACTACCRFMDEVILGKLLSEFGAASDSTVKLQVILKWANEWDEDDNFASLRAFMEAHVDFSQVASKDWVDFSAKYERGVEFCCTPKNCNTWIDAVKFSDRGSCKGVSPWSGHLNTQWSNLGQKQTV
ncbi:hypothetical protein HDU98_003791 [Podochytrium sp. JEL0797]|nr:hypothetical protein HDU98_003791 [Podochytrium sp. JEL0797]